MTTKSSKGISDALMPRLAMLDFPRRWFVAPRQALKGEATQGADGRQAFSVYNLETAGLGPIQAFFKECLATVPEAKHREGLRDIDISDPMQRWWALNEVLDHGGQVPLWESNDVALQAVATMNGNTTATSSAVAS